MKTRTRTVQELIIPVKVTEADISNGECQIASRCMEKVAIARTLMARHRGQSDADLRVQIDAGHCRFNLYGHRWVADTPKAAKDALIRFDRKESVAPHGYKLVARRTSKIVPPSRERQDQVNAARRARIRAGVPDKVYSRKTLRKRVVGFV